MLQNQTFFQAFYLFNIFSIAWSSFYQSVFFFCILYCFRKRMRICNYCLLYFFSLISICPFSILSETLFTAFCFLKYLHKFCVCNIISIFSILPYIFYFLLKYNLSGKNKDLMKFAKFILSRFLLYRRQHKKENFETTGLSENAKGKSERTKRKAESYIRSYVSS